MENKRKWLYVALFALIACVVALILVFTLKDNHIHDFTGDSHYEIVTSGTNKKAFSWKVCPCGEETEHKEVENSVVVTPQTIQEELDKDINNKIIILSPGIYNDTIYLRVSKATIDSAYSYISGQTYTVGEEVYINDIVQDASIRYHYVRKITNVTIAGTEGVVIKERIYADSRAMFNYDSSIDYWLGYDAVRNMVTKNFVQHIQLENVTFTGLNFEGDDGKIDLVASAYGKASMKNITVSNCKFVTTNSQSGACIYITTTAVSDSFKGVKISNNYIEGHYQGFASYDMSDVLVCDNTIKNSLKHGLVILSFDSENKKDRGYIKIENNVIDTCYNNAKESGDFYNDGHYAIRLNVAKDTEISIKNNHFNNTYKIIVMATNLQTCEYEFTDNTYAGNKISDVIGLTTFVDTEVTLNRPN